MEILLWLVPAAVTTGLAMLWATWAGRERPERRTSEADQQRMAAALSRPLPQADAQRTRERSTGVAVRPSARPGSGNETRRSA